MKTRFKVLGLAILFLCAVAFSLTSVVFAAVSADVGGDFAITYIPSNDLFNTSSKTFNTRILDNLLKQISGDETSSATNMDTVNNLATQKTTSAQMREFNVGKAAGEDITIEFGGLNWTVTYLSTDDAGNTILTLWLDESTQLSRKTYDTNKTFDTNGTATWSSGWYNSSTSVDYPSAMYGTSYMSAVVLNNGGQYAHSTANNSSDITLVSADQNPDSAFALFTMTDLGLTQFLVTPEHVLWQKEGQSTKALIDDLSYNSPNENWSNDVTDDGFYSSDFNYAHKTGNDEWKNDHLWLPSLSETGYNDSSNGIWATSQNQRKNVTKSWLRTGVYSYAGLADFACYQNKDGSVWGSGMINGANAVRPALHLNLTAAVRNAT